MKLTVSLSVGDGAPLTHDFYIADSDSFRGIEVGTDAGPIMRMPFYLHGERLHTICQRATPEGDDPTMDEIKEVEW